MANIKVSEMTEATVFDDGDYAMIVQGNQNKKIAKENMLANVGDISNLETTDKSDVVSSINEVNDIATNNAKDNIYSLQETETSKIWIDGKKIYRKVISAEVTSYGEQVAIATGFTNEEASAINDIWVNKGKTFLKRPSGIIYVGIGASSNDAYWFDVRQINATRTTVSCMVGSSIYSGSIVYITLEYTKTTD